MNPFQAMFHGVDDESIDRSAAWATPRLQQGMNFMQEKVGNKNKKAGKALGAINSLFSGVSNVLQGGQGTSQNLRNIGNFGLNALGTLGSVVNSFSKGGMSQGFGAIANGLGSMFNEGMNVLSGFSTPKNRVSSHNNQGASRVDHANAGSGSIPVPPPLPNTSSFNAQQSAPVGQGGGSFVNEIQNFNRSGLNHVQQNTSAPARSGSFVDQLNSFDRSSLRHVEQSPSSSSRGSGTGNPLFDQIQGASAKNGLRHVEPNARPYAQKTGRAIDDEEERRRRQGQ